MWTANGDWLTSGPIWLRDGHSFSPLSVKQWPRQSFSTFQVNLLLNSFRAFKYNAVQQGKDCGEWRLRTVKRSFVRVKHRPTSSTVSRNYIYIFFLFKATTMFRSPSTVARYLFTVEIAAMGKLLSRAVLLWFHIDREGSAEMFFSLPNFNRCRAPCKSFGRNREEFPVQCRRLGFPLWKGWKGSRARKMTMATRWIFCFPSSTSRQFSHFEEPPAEIEGASRNLFLIWTPWWLLQHRRVWHGMTSAARSLAALSPSPPPLYSLLDIYPPGGVICPVSFPFCLPCARLFSREDLQHIVRFQTLIFDTPSVSSLLHAISTADGRRSFDSDSTTRWWLLLSFTKWWQPLS